MRRAAQTDSEVRGAARTLGCHAALVGIGWFVVALPAMLFYKSGASAPHWASDLSSELQGMFAVVVALAVVPLAWPVYIGIGWVEGQLALRLAAGDRDAIRPAVILLVAQAVAFAAIAAVALLISFSEATGSWMRNHAVLAWLPPAVIAAMHAAVASLVSQPEDARSRWVDRYR